MIVANFNGRDISSDEVFENPTYGKYNIIEYIGKDKYNNKIVKVRFIDTGTEVTLRLKAAIDGHAIDRFAPIIYGVGYSANANTAEFKREYDLWRKMLARCYNKNENNYDDYGALGVKVDERWHNFANFLSDLPNLPGYAEWIKSTGREWHLDKDTLQQHLPKNQRVYSKDTCMFIPAASNLRTMTNEHEFDSKYNGVRRLMNRERFIARIVINKVRYSLGIYDDEEVAASVYNFVLTANGFNETFNFGVPDFDLAIAQKHFTSSNDIQLPVPGTPVILKGTKYCKYTGLKPRCGNYTATIRLGGKTLHVGTFSNEEAAAVVREWYLKTNSSSPSIHNNVTGEMSLYEALKYRVYKNSSMPVQMCHIVDNTVCQPSVTPAANQTRDMCRIVDKANNGLREMCRIINK